LSALVLIFGIFSNGVMAEVCVCGQSCMHDVQDGSGARVNCLFHKHCSGAHCRSCNIEEGQTFKTVNTSAPNGNVKIFNAICIKSVLVGYPYADYVFKSLGSSHAYVKAPSLPIYLQNLSLLI
jgi:hypothetical protein